MALERVAAASELPVGEPRGFEVDGVPVCVVRLDEDTVKAVHDVCSHQEYPLHEGEVLDGEIECPLHGSTFDLDSGEPQCLPAVKPVPVYAAEVADGGIYVDVAAQRNDAAPPGH